MTEAERLLMVELRDARRAGNEAAMADIAKQYRTGPQKKAFRKRAKSRQEHDPSEIKKERRRVRGGGQLGLLDPHDLTRIHKSKAKGNEDIEAFHRACDQWVIARAILKRRAEEADLTVREYITNSLHPEERHVLKSLMPDARSRLSKAMDTATSGSGNDWVPPAEMSASFYGRVDYATEVWGMFQSEQMRRNNVRVGVMGSRPVFSYVPESKDDSSALIPATTPGTSNAVLTARKMAARLFVSTEMEEESFWGAVARVDDDLPNGAAYYLEQCVIDGDNDAGTGSLDTGVTHPGGDARRTFNGLRYHWHVTEGADDGTERVELGAQLAHNDITTVLGYAKQYKSPKASNFWLTSENGLREISQLLDKASGTPVYGREDTAGANRSLVVTGELPQFYGRDLVVSEHVREDLNDDGIYDGSTTDQTVLMLIHKPSFVRGTLRGLTVKSEEEIDTDQIKMVATMRVAFTALYGASEPSIVGISELVW